MPKLNIALCFPFRRIKITKQTVGESANKTIIRAIPGKRFKPVSHLCGKSFICSQLEIIA